MSGLSKESVLLDVCCGTGTIGLSLANRCSQVYGVELIEDAVINANKNAERNGIKNAEFIAGIYIRIARSTNRK